MNVLIDQKTGKLKCAWFAKCTNDATTLVEHPILDQVPACAFCAAKSGSRVFAGKFTVTFDINGDADGFYFTKVG